MTYTTRKNSYSSSNSSSLISRRKPHRKNFKQNDDFSDPWQSQSQSSYAPSEPETNSPSDQFSLPETNEIKPPPCLSSPSNTQNWYVPIAALPMFHGTSDDCPVTHLSRFAKFCRANFILQPTVDVMMRIFPVTLENEAALWYDLNIEPYPSLNWDEIRSLFLEAYNNIELKTELTTIHQGEEEAVRSYFLRLQWILKRWDESEVGDDLIKGVFMNGLREEFRDWIVPQKPDSLNDALRLALGFEQVRSIRGVTKMEVKCGFCDEDGHEEKGCEVRERMKRLWVERTEEEEKSQVGKELVRCDSVSMGKSEGGEGKKKKKKKKKKKRQCQCWKKELERSKTLGTGSFNVDVRNSISE